MSSDDLERKLSEMDEARERMRKRLSDSEAVIESIGDKIDDLQRRQLERMRADTRIDDHLVDQVESGSDAAKRKQRRDTAQEGYVEIIVGADGSKTEVVHERPDEQD